MKVYVAITGGLFGLLTLAHIVRLFAEPHLAGDPLFIGVTILSGALCVWSWRVGRRASRS